MNSTVACAAVVAIVTGTAFAWVCLQTGRAVRTHVKKLRQLLPSTTAAVLIGVVTCREIGFGLIGYTIVLLQECHRPSTSCFPPAVLIVMVMIVLIVDAYAMLMVMLVLVLVVKLMLMPCAGRCVGAFVGRDADALANRYADACADVCVDRDVDARADRDADTCANRDGGC